MERPMNEHHREQGAWNEFLKYLCSKQLVDNVECPTVAVTAGGRQWPVTMNSTGKPSTSWVASLRNAYGPYARAESRMVGLPKSQVLISDIASVLGEQVLRATGLADALILNNWLISTNLLTTDFDAATVEDARARLQFAYPGKTVMIRSLLREHHADLMHSLAEKGWLFFPTRQVWLMDQLHSVDFRKRRDIKADLKLNEQMCQRGVWCPAESFNQEDWVRAVDLYDQLYRVKYPAHNPAYNMAFLTAAHETGWLQIKGWRNNEGRLDGVVGLLRRPEWLSCPLLGYDLSRPHEEGLYRRLSLQSILTAEAENRILHLSAGAGLFKQTRGASFVVEYAAAHVASGKARRWLAETLSGALSRWAVPALASHVF